MLSLRFLAALLWQRRLVFCFVFLVVLSGAAAFILTRPPQFVAETLLAIDNRPLRSVQGTISGQEQANPLERVDATVLAGEVNLLTSRAILERVVVELGLDNDAEFVPRPGPLAIAKSGLLRLLRQAGFADGHDGPVPDEQRREKVLRSVAKQLVVEVPRGSSQIRVSFRAADPAKAAVVVNKLVSIHLKDQTQAKQSVAAQTLAGLSERSRALHDRVRAADEAVQSFRNEHRLLRTAGPSPLTQQLNDLTMAEQRARTEAQDASARLEMLRSLNSSSVEAVAALNIANQQLLSDLIVQDADARAKLASAASKLGSSHPAVQEFRAQAREINDRLAAQRSLIAANLRNEAAVLNGRHQRLAEELRTVRERLRRENELDGQVGQLESEARAARAAHDDFLVGYNRVLALAGSAVPDMRVLYAAEAPELPSFPKLPLLLISVPVAALVAAMSAVLLHLVTATKRHTSRQFEESYGVPVIGTTPLLPDLNHSSNPGAHLARDPLSEYAEAVRGIRNAIDFERRSVASVAVVSAVAGEGKSTLAVSLATAWAAAGARTLLIDCDTRRSAMPRMLQCAKASGLTDVLSAELVGSALVQRNARLGFDLIVAGQQNSEMSYRFTRDRVRELIASFKPRYDKIILDLPPVLAVSDGEVGAAASDLVLFVSHWGRTSPDATRAAIERLRRFGVTEVRGVLSQVDRRMYTQLGSVNQYLYSPYPDPFDPSQRPGPFGRPSQS